MNLNNKSYKIFVDFDGTISLTDIGEAMFLRFGDEVKSQEYVKLWENNEINSVELWKLLCNTVKNMNDDDFNVFLDSIEIDPGFKNFVAYCEKENYEIKILSDGFDYYIQKFLQREGLGHLEVFCNRLFVDNDNNLIPQFPYMDEECTRCANCKRNHVLNYSGEDDYTFYIGNGLTDVCPSQFCDFIFAKSSLLRHCEINRITYFPFTTFNDVVKKIDELKDKKRLRKRHQAELKRREVFLQG